MEFDWSQIRTYGLIAVAIYAAWYYGRGALPWLKNLVSTTAPAQSRQAATGHADALIEYFQSVGCKEGEKAARTAGACLFSETHEGGK